jgi:hypothetical protein
MTRVIALSNESERARGRRRILIKISCARKEDEGAHFRPPELLRIAKIAERRRERAEFGMARSLNVYAMQRGNGTGAIFSLVGRKAKPLCVAFDKDKARARASASAHVQTAPLHSTRTSYYLLVG